MQTFADFEKWMEDDGVSREIGQIASEAAMEYIRAGKADSLTAEQQEAVFNLSIRISSQVAAGLLKAYHEWTGRQA
ncbi:hypothetical protein LJC49_00955 [Ruminococcaceae bacterium OttesenSCG-928-I18]|nr:hypothetical protein [Ruminococcaceae bacterium OttesenSCG-928-I18]